MLVRELLFELGFDDARATANAKKFDKVIDGVKRNVMRLGAIAGAAAITLGAKALQAGNDYQEMSNKLRLVTDSAEELRSAQDGIYEAAQRSRSGLQATADLFFGLSKASEQYGYTQKEVLRITETIAKLATMSGNDPNSIGAALFQLRQGIMSGQLRGQELNSVLEQATPVAEAIAAGMNVPFEKLRENAEKGLITGNEVLKALSGQAEKTDAEFAKMQTTAKQAKTVFANAFGHHAGRIAEEGASVKALVNFWSELTKIVENPSFTRSLVLADRLIAGVINGASKLIKIMNNLIDRIGGLEEAFRLIATALAAAFGVGLIQFIWNLKDLAPVLTKLAGGLKAFALGLMGATWQITAAAAAIALLFLLLDDLWNWVHGNDSVTGRVLGTWENFRDQWLLLWSDIMSPIQPFLNAIEKLTNIRIGKAGFRIAEAGIFQDPKNPLGYSPFDIQNLAAPSFAGPRTAPQNNMTVHTNITVPPGTNREQVDHINAAVMRAVHEAQNKQMREVMANFPDTE